jgi:hypothetical protein
MVIKIKKAKEKRGPFLEHTYFFMELTISKFMAANKNLIIHGTQETQTSLT